MAYIIFCIGSYPPNTSRPNSMMRMRRPAMQANTQRPPHNSGRAYIFLGLFITALTGCQAVPQQASQQVVGTPLLTSHSAEGRGQKLAANRCSDCHSVGYGETSPVAHAPSFSAIANTPELSKSSLNRWMLNHKNYPSEMYFEIPAEHVDDLIAYILTLRRPNRE